MRPAAAGRASFEEEGGKGRQRGEPNAGRPGTRAEQAARRGRARRGRPAVYGDDVQAELAGSPWMKRLMWRGGVRVSGLGGYATKLNLYAISDIQTGRDVSARAERLGCRSVSLRWFEADRTSTVLMVLFSAGSGLCGICRATEDGGMGWGNPRLQMTNVRFPSL